MMDGMRRAGKSVIGRIVIALLFGFLIFSFMLWGIGDIFRGYGTRTIATIGSSTVDVEPYRQAFQSELQQLSRRYGRNITTEQAVMAGVDQQVLNRMIAEATLNELAHSYRLGIPDDKLASMVTSDPTFAGPDGKFDRQQFNETIRQAGYTEQRFLNEQRQVALRQQIVQAIAGTPAAPATIRDALNRYGHEERKIRYMTIGEAQIGKIAAPTDDQLKTFFDDAKDQFRLPEFRKFVAISLRPTDLADPKTINDADAKAEFDRVKDRLGKPERRVVRQIVFPNKDEAKAAHEKIASGKSFSDIAAERNLKEVDTNLGLVSQQDIADKTVATAVFKLEKDAVSDVIDGSFGSVIATVVEIQPGEAASYEQFADKIKLDLATKKVRADIRDLHDKIEDLRAAAKPLDAIAKDLSLKLLSYDGIDRAGRDNKKAAVDTIPERDTLINSVFSSDVGVDNEAVTTRDGGYVWFDVTGIVPARDRTLDEARKEVEDAWRQDDIAKRLGDKAKALVDEINGGKPIDQVAKSISAELKTSEKLTRSSRNKDLSQSVLAQAFSAAPKSAASAMGASPTERVIIYIDDAAMPAAGTAAPDLAKIESDLKSGFSDDYSSVYLSQTETALGVKINDATLKLAIGAN